MLTMWPSEIGPLCRGGTGTTEQCSLADFFPSVLSAAIQEGGFWAKSRMAFHYRHTLMLILMVILMMTIIRIMCKMVKQLMMMVMMMIR